MNDEIPTLLTSTLLSTNARVETLSAIQMNSNHNSPYTRTDSKHSNLILLSPKGNHNSSYHHSPTTISCIHPIDSNLIIQFLTRLSKITHTNRI